MGTGEKDWIRDSNSDFRQTICLFNKAPISSMAQADIDCRDLEESFSFSCYDLNSTLGTFSDNEDDDHESYIEIALQPTPDPEQFDFRISFSSLPLSQLSPQAPAHKVHLLPLLDLKNPETHSSSTGFSYGDESTPVTPSTELSSPPKTIHRSRKVNMFLRSLRRSPKISEENDRPEANRQMIVKMKSRELDRSRKASKITTAINGGIMKFLIKFRSLKIRSTLVSLVKPYQLTSRQTKTKSNNGRMSEDTLHNHRRPVKPFDKSMMQGDQKPLGNGGKSRVMEINVDAIKGVLEAVSLSIGRKCKETKSCPSSIKSSPIHRGVPSENRIYARENSVQAAIAHCKRSFGGASDFCF